jgi:hypothetical protein
MTEVQQVPVVPVENQRPPQQPLRPHRGGVILALGILGLVACFICGIFAWIMGKNDLWEMDTGRMDPSGRGLTKAGRICGIVSVILPIAVICLWLLMAILIGAGSTLSR